MSDITDAAEQLTLAAKKANETTDFFDDVTTLGDSETVTNPNNGVTVPSVQKQIKDLYDGSETEINLAVAASESARDESVEAKDETQALFDGFDASVAESISMVDGEGPILDIPFYHDGEILMGNGVRNSYGNKAVSYTRSGTSQNVNRTGVMEELSDNEIAINSDGAACFQSLTNIVLNSEDGTESSWIVNGSVTVELVSCDLAAFNNATRITSSGTQGGIYQNLYDNGGSKTYVTSVWARASKDGVVMRNGIESASVGNVALTTEWKRYHSILPNLTSSNLAMWKIAEADSGDWIEIAGMQSCESNILRLPYIRTAGTTMTRQGDTISIPVSGNFPEKKGDGLTIFIDFLYPLQAGDTSTGFLFETNTRNIGLYVSNGTVVFRAESTLASVFGGLLTGLSYRAAVVMIGDNITAYVNGIKGANSVLESGAISGISTFQLGRTGSGALPINSYFRNFKVFDYAMTEDQVKAKGGI